MTPWTRKITVLESELATVRAKMQGYLVEMGV